MDLKTSMALRNYGVNPGMQNLSQRSKGGGIDFSITKEAQNGFPFKASELTAPPKKDFSEVMRAAAVSALGSLQGAEQTAVAGVTGKADAQSVAEAMADAEMTVRAVTAVRDKVVEAYQEILRMPI